MGRGLLQMLAFSEGYASYDSDTVHGYLHCEQDNCSYFVSCYNNWHFQLE